MFILTQLIGLYVINFYISDGITLPYGFDQRTGAEFTTGEYSSFFISLAISFIIAIFVVFLLMRIKFLWFFRVWFFIVVSLALGLTFTIITTKLNLVYPSFFALIIGLILAYIKIFRRNILVHNLTELLIYPGIAAIFVSILNIWTTIAVLILISIYDIWAVWHSGIMQKMAKFQMNDVGVFGGFLLPYASKEMKEKIRLLKLKYKNSKIPEKAIRKKGIKVNLAILGGGDIVFPIIASGVMLKTMHNFYAPVIIIIFSSLALLYLLVTAEKRKSYPAMPYLTTGIFIGMLISWIISRIL
jgi:presenilin-like A22 family membrane protease